MSIRTSGGWILRREWLRQWSKHCQHGTWPEQRSVQQPEQRSGQQTQQRYGQQPERARAHHAIRGHSNAKDDGGLVRESIAYSPTRRVIPTARLFTNCRRLHDPCTPKCVNSRLIELSSNTDIHIEHPLSKSTRLPYPKIHEFMAKSTEINIQDNKATFQNQVHLWSQTFELSNAHQYVYRRDQFLSTPTDETKS